MKTLSLAEAAARVDLTEMTLRRHINAGKLPKAESTRGIRVRESDLQRAYPEAFGGVVPREQQPCRIIAFANQKGGVGKTSTCANLAAALSQAGNNVLAIDCDAQGNLTLALGPNPDTLEITIYNVLTERMPLEKAIINPILGQSTLYLVGANIELSAADLQLSGSVAGELRLRQAIEPYRDRFDYILLDCPPNLGQLTLNALAAATDVIIPVNPGSFAIRGVSKLMDTISDVRAVNPNLERVQALTNLADNTNLAVDVRAELARAFGDNLLVTTIRRSVRVGEAQAAQMPITAYRPKDPASLDYHTLAQEIIANGA